MNQKNGRTDPRPAARAGEEPVHLAGHHRRNARMGHAPPTGRHRPHARHGTGQQGGVQTGKAHAPGPVPGAQKPRRYDFANVRLPDGYTKEQLTGLDFAAKAQDLVFYGKTGRGKTHLATAWA